MPSYFAHQNITRKVTVAFMNLFNDLYVQKYREGKPFQLYRVPLQFANREKWLESLQNVTNLHNREGDFSNTRVEIDTILPRMSVNLTSMTYASERHVHKTNKVVGAQYTDGTVNKRRNVFAPVPYNLEYELAILAKSVDDCMQLIEQIIPFFAPSTSINIKVFGEEYESDSVPVVIQSVTPMIDEEVAFEDQRLITFLLTFMVKMNYWPPTRLKMPCDGGDQGLIETVEANVRIGDLDESYAKFDQYVENANIGKIPPPSGWTNDATEYYVINH